MANRTIYLVIPGKPIAKARPRFYRKGKHVGTYNCQQTEEGRFLLQVTQQFTGEPIKGPVKLHLVFNMPIPKSYTKKKRCEIETGAMQHTKKPDLDNLLKFVKDCLNGVAWIDDSQVYFESAIKIYGGVSSTEITIEEV